MQYIFNAKYDSMKLNFKQTLGEVIYVRILK